MSSKNWSVFRRERKKKERKLDVALGVLLVRGRERDKETERSSAAAARSRIHGFAKSLLTTDSAYWDGCMSIFYSAHTINNIYFFFRLLKLCFLFQGKVIVHEENNLFFFYSTKSCCQRNGYSFFSFLKITFLNKFPGITVHPLFFPLFSPF